MSAFSYLLVVLLISPSASAQDEFEMGSYVLSVSFLTFFRDGGLIHSEFNLLATRTSTTPPPTTTDILSQWIADLQKQEKQKVRNLLVVKKSGENNVHPLCKLYCQLYELCVVNELLRPLCGKPAGCGC
ncbi:hypothetical protein Y032_0009g762 [Ancylostoma ceylanicum]|uniref:Uncharacterized protein n=1 Tax=Ancylostoma ceylanicum TaxID=53326 RepID=A0A016VKE7_9BILA|nr:hypothetical protein Y032_0009g762 [Ancylostoma ceylanicum]